MEPREPSWSNMSTLSHVHAFTRSLDNVWAAQQVVRVPVQGHGGASV